MFLHHLLIYLTYFEGFWSNITLVLINKLGDAINKSVGMLTKHGHDNQTDLPCLGLNGCDKRGLRRCRSTREWPSFWDNRPIQITKQMTSAEFTWTCGPCDYRIPWFIMVRLYLTQLKWQINLMGIFRYSMQVFFFTHSLSYRWWKSLSTLPKVLLIYIAT